MPKGSNCKFFFKPVFGLSLTAIWLVGRGLFVFVKVPNFGRIINFGKGASGGGVVENLDIRLLFFD